MLTGIACFNSDVIVFRCVKVSELGGVLFAAVRANHPPEGPNRKARRAKQVPVATFRRRLFVPQETDLRIAATERASGLVLTYFSVTGAGSCFRQPTCVWL